MLQRQGEQRKPQKTCLCWHIGRPSGRFRSLWGRSWQLFGRSWVVWGRSWPLLERSWDALGASWAPLGRLLDLLDATWTPLGRNLEKSQGLGPPCWTSFGGVLGHFFAFFRIFFAFLAHLKSSWLILSIIFVFCSIFLDFAWISGGFWEGSGKNFR